MARQDASVENDSEFDFGLFLNDIAEHIECKVVDVELNPSPEHDTTEDEPPELVIVSDTGLELGEECKLYAIPLLELTKIVHQMHWLHNPTITNHTMQLSANRWNVMVENENSRNILFILFSTRTCIRMYSPWLSAYFDYLVPRPRLGLLDSLPFFSYSCIWYYSIIDQQIKNIHNS